MGAARRALRASYPFLIAATPVVYLALHNADQVTPQQTVVPLLLALGTAGVLLWAGARVFGRPVAAILVAVLLVGLFTGGSLHQALIERFGAGAYWLAFGFALALAAGALFGVWRYARGSPARQEAATTLLSIMSLVLFLNMSVGLLLPDKRRVFFDPDRVTSDDGPREHPVLAAESAQFPDIYYIIADTYGRDDVIRDLYGHDNGEFTAWLESRGFYVARESWSNYPITFLSLASSLNMRYLDEQVEQAVARKRGSRDYTPLYRMIHRADVPERLQQKGYRYAQTLTHWGGTDRSANADIRYKFAPFLGDEFTGTLANMTLLRVFAPTIDELHRFVAASVPRMAELEGPTFGFVHLLLPHNPYVFDRDGRVIASHPLTLSLKGQDRVWHVREPFVEQLRYTNTLLRRMIDDILARAPTPPMIILQGDHGTSLAEFDGGVRTVAEPVERLAILNAYLVPEAMRARLYPDITPVNTFRLLLSAQFGDDLAPLPDLSYFSYQKNPYDLRDVTAELRGGAAATPVAAMPSP
jgi:hypothetical protein